MLALLGFIGMSGVLAQSTHSTASPERMLLERSLSPSWGPASLKTTVLVKQVPGNLGFNLPPQSQVIGSVVTDTPDPSYPTGITVYFDTPLSPEQVLAYFAKTLPGQNWKPIPLPNAAQQQGGFQATAALDGKSYYHLKPDEQLNIGTRVVGKTTQVTVTRQRNNDVENLLRYAETDQAFEPTRLLPKLTPPAGATVSPRGGGGSNNSVTQYATIESALSRVALFDHYAAQLKQAGWTLRNRSDAGSMSSSLWSFTRNDKEQVGLLLIAEANKGVYRATLAIQGLD